MKYNTKLAPNQVVNVIPVFDNTEYGHFVQAMPIFWNLLIPLKIKASC